MIIRPTSRNHPNFYELALLLADGQAHQSADGWEDFIANLSRICDEFAVHISPDEEIAHTIVMEGSPSMVYGAKAPKAIEQFDRKWALSRKNDHAFN